MKIRIYPDHPSLPIGPASGLVGSAMPLAIVGVPYGATNVGIAAFNADGIACNLSATKMGGEWVATVPASHFASYGVISRGLQISVTFKDAAGVSQTVLFVGDMRIEAAAAGDPAGHGVPSVPITEVAEVPEGSPMKDIRDTVNRLARIVSGTATALALAFCAFGATPLEEIPGTNEVYTAAETDAAISDAISSLPPSGVTTNDVKNIVTNETLVSYVADLPYDRHWEVSQDSAKFTITDFYWEGDTVHYMCNGTLYVTNSFEESQRMAIDRDVYLYVTSDNPITVGSTPDEWVLEIGTRGGFDGYPSNYFKPYIVNSLGLARLIDLPSLTNNLSNVQIINGAGYTTTNDVCNIVTNTVTGFSDWVFSPQTNADEEVVSLLFGYDGYNQWSLTGMNSIGEAVFSFVASGGEDATSLVFDNIYTATREYMPPRNALGLARLKDLDDKTTAASVTNIVRDLSLGGIWDPDIEVWWTPRMRGGSLTYEATTNVNLNAGN